MGRVVSQHHVYKSHEPSAQCTVSVCACVEEKYINKCRLLSISSSVCEQYTDFLFYCDVMKVGRPIVVQGALPSIRLHVYIDLSIALLILMCV